MAVQIVAFGRVNTITPAMASQAAFHRESLAGFLIALTRADFEARIPRDSNFCPTYSRASRAETGACAGGFSRSVADLAYGAARLCWSWCCLSRNRLN